jgi:quinol monooxygenase YgiN
MYGTVARWRLKPGARAQLDAEMAAFHDRRVPGFVTEYVYQMDGDPDELYLAVVFESKEAYEANAQSPEQHAQYERLVALMAGEPEWHDGTIIHTLAR